MANRLYVIVEDRLVRLEGTGDFVGMHVEVIDMDTDGADKDELEWCATRTAPSSRRSAAATRSARPTSRRTECFLPGTYKAEGHASAPSGQSCHFSAARRPRYEGVGLRRAEKDCA